MHGCAYGVAVGSRMRRAVAVWVFGALGIAGAARAVALPELCTTPTEVERAAAVEGAVRWISANQAVDGMFLYRYDLVDDRIEEGYNWVRHAGTMLALAQAANSGIDIGVTFERAMSAIGDRIVVSDDGLRAGLLDSGSVSTGGTALLLLALFERKQSGGSVDGALVSRLLAFIESSLTPRGDDGSLIAREYASTTLEFRDGRPGRFTSGQVAFALAKARNSVDGFDGSDDVRGVLRYLIRHKAADEGFVPDMADHWAAYALAEMTTWSGGSGLTGEEVDWARKQMGIASVMVRYESQRSNGGFDRWLRGRTAVGSAVGTHGEMLSGLLVVADAVPELDGLTRGVADRLRCNLGVLVDRQISTDEAASYPDPGRASGSWAWFDTTQVDDQQHALSALVKGGEVLASGIVERGDALPSSWLLVVLSVVAVLNPPRIARAVRVGDERRRRLRGRLRLSTPYVVSIVGGGWMLELLDASVPTAVVASGVVVVLGGLALMVARRPDPSVALAVIRPEALVLALSASAGGRGWAVVVGLVVSMLWAASLARRHEDDVLAWSARAGALVSVALGVLLIVNGVYAV